MKTGLLTTRLISGTLLLALTTLVFAETVAPENYLDGPLTIIVPRGQGGGSHKLAMKMAAELEEIISVEVLIENIPADGGEEAIREFMKRPRDGRTLLQHVDDAPAAYAKGNIKVDPTTDMLPVAVVQITFSQLYIRNTETRFSDWAEFLRYAREHPGELTVSLVGHEDAMEALLLEMLTREAGIQVAHESYNKPSERYLSLVRGKVDALIEQPGDVRVFLDSRMIKPILTLLPEPHPAFPDAAGLNSVEEELPTLHRARMFFAHGDLPKAKLAYLEWALKKAYDSNGFRAFNEDHYMNLIDSYRDIDGGKKFVGDMISTFKKINGQ